MKPFPWRAGMLAVARDGDGLRRVLWVGGDMLGFCGLRRPSAEYSPSLTDPATIGALLGAVEEAWAHLGVITVVAPVAAAMGEPWRVRIVNYLGDYHAVFEAPTRFGALMMAWEASP